MSAVAVPPSPGESARALAREIRARRIGLDNEDRLAVPGTPLRSHARAAKWRALDRAQVNGMVIGLTYMLGEPLDMAAAEAFIASA